MVRATSNKSRVKKEDGIKKSKSSKTAATRLSQEELLFLMRLLELPDLPGVGEKPWGEVELEAAEQLFKEAGLALQSRGLVALDENEQPIVEKSLKDILFACAYPQQMFALIFSRGKTPPQQAYYYHGPDFDVRQTLPEPRVHLFQMIPVSDMGYAEVNGLFENWNWDFSSPAVQIAQETYDQAQRIGLSDTQVARRLLHEAGMQADLASALSDMMSNHGLKLIVQWVYQLNPQVDQMTISLLAGESSCWLAESVSLGKNRFVKVMAVDMVSLKRILLIAFQPFEIPETVLN